MHHPRKLLLNNRLWIEGRGCLIEYRCFDPASPGLFDNDWCTSGLISLHEVGVFVCCAVQVRPGEQSIRTGRNRRNREMSVFVGVGSAIETFCVVAAIGN